MRSLSCALIVAETGRGIVGYALIEFRRGSKTARLFSIARDDGASKGLGRALLGASEAEAQRRGCDLMRLESREDNHRALRLYERAGFARFARVENYYEDGAPALRLEKRLAAAT